MSYVPLSVTHGGPRKRMAWRIKGWREKAALWLAPWLACRSDATDGSTAEAARDLRWAGDWWEESLRERLHDLWAGGPRDSSELPDSYHASVDESVDAMLEMVREHDAQLVDRPNA